MTERCSITLTLLMQQELTAAGLVNISPGRSSGCVFGNTQVISASAEKLAFTSNMPGDSPEPRKLCAPDRPFGKSGPAGDGSERG
jgi:hypothetical protein